MIILVAVIDSEFSFLVENPRKKESVDSKLARGHVSKFYWWVAIRSRVWGLVSLIV